MGGFGSGRHGGKPTIEGTGAYELSVRAIRPAFRIGQRSTAEIKFDDGHFLVRVTIDLRDAWNHFIELKHAARDQGGQGREVTGQVQLVQTMPTFGGYRWWFLCPRTAYRTTKLFLPRGGQYFLSRQVYGLAYDSQREGRLDQLRRRAVRLSYQLGETDWDFWALPPPRPKWMRWRTYDRKVAEWDSATEAARAEFAEDVNAILGRLREPVWDDPIDLCWMLDKP